MIKLYKTSGNARYYWEAWATGNEITIHWGTVGQEGEYREIQVRHGVDPNSIINREAEVRRFEGYCEIDKSELFRIVIQYVVAGMGSAGDLSRRNRVENLMNEALGWTGLGHCDGGDIGSGTMNVFCFVVDVQTALQVIVEELGRNNLLEDVAIALTLGQGYEMLWPSDSAKPFSLVGDG